MNHDSHFTNNEILIQMYCNSIDIMWGLTSGTFVIHCTCTAQWETYGLLASHLDQCTVGCHMVTHSN